MNKQTTKINRYSITVIKINNSKNIINKYCTVQLTNILNYKDTTIISIFQYLDPIWYNIIINAYKKKQYLTTKGMKKLNHVEFKGIIIKKVKTINYTENPLIGKFEN